MKLERKQNYVAVPGVLLRDLNDYRKTNNLSGKKVGHVIFDQEASLFINSNLDLLFAEAILRNNKTKCFWKMIKSSDKIITNNKLN